MVVPIDAEPRLLSQLSSGGGGSRRIGGWCLFSLPSLPCGTTCSRPARGCPIRPHHLEPWPQRFRTLPKHLANAALLPSACGAPRAPVQELEQATNCFKDDGSKTLLLRVYTSGRLIRRAPPEYSRNPGQRWRTGDTSWGVMGG